MVRHSGQLRSLSANSLNLVKIRTESGRTLEQIADTTKISIRFLRAIEAEDFDQLPGGIFTRSYLRQYATEIGLDAGGLLEMYRVHTALAGDAA